MERRAGAVADRRGDDRGAEDRSVTRLGHSRRTGAVNLIVSCCSVLAREADELPVVQRARPAAGEVDRGDRRTGRGQRRGPADCRQRLNVPISRACSMTWLAIRSSNARRSRPGSRSRSSSSA